MREGGGAEGPMELLVDREGHGVSAGDLYLDVGRCAFRREGGGVAPPARARVSKAVGKRFEGSLVGGDAERH